MSIKDLAELKKRERELLELNNDLDSKQVDFNKEMVFFFDQNLGTDKIWERSPSL